MKSSQLQQKTKELFMRTHIKQKNKRNIHEGHIS